MDKYIGDIITEQREDTRNTDIEALSESRILRYNQYAQDRIFSLISISYNWAFEKTIVVPLVANQEEYTIADNLAFGTRISNVEFSAESDGKYIPLTTTPDRYTQLLHAGRPRFYKRRQGSILIEPIPSSSQGSLRITYERALDKLALRVGRIDGTPSGTDLDLSYTGEEPTTANEALFVENTYVCVTDPFGTPLLYNGIIASYNAGTDVITLTGNVEDYLVTGKTLADLDGAYVTLGKYTCTHSSLPSEAENYFIEWVCRKLHNVDDSDQYRETEILLNEMLESIVASFKFADKARKSFPIHDFEILIPEYD